MELENIKPLKELLDSVRDIEGFPIGKDEDILALSDPPHYTACPNPYINDFIKEHGKPYDEATDNYHREPFVSDVSEGKNDPIYSAHSYHTKVPHKAIMKYIEHYTEQGDIVFDGFCGTGMTGVAAQLLNRKVILSDLSPIATFIAHNYNKKNDVKAFESEANRILQEVEDECGWMYETNHVGENVRSAPQLSTDGKEVSSRKGKINYTVWSDVFICVYCGKEIIFWNAAVEKESGVVKKDFSCPHCNAKMTKSECERAGFTFFDNAIGEEIRHAKQIPVLINYTYNKKRYEKGPDADDLALIRKIENTPIPHWFPTDKMPIGYNTAQPIKSHGFTHVNHFYSIRNLYCISSIKDKIKNNILLFYFTSILMNASKQYRFRSNRKGGINTGIIYISSLNQENNFFNLMKRKLRTVKLLNYYSSSIISTNSTTQLSFGSNCIDYIFTDPPFGDNIMYSELSYMWESWLKVKTDNKPEAIINTVQTKDLKEYSDLMLKSFREYFRTLKPNRWITVEFHNSKSSVWNTIQEAMSKAGFVIANVSILDKKQGSFKQVTSAGAVKNDLVISAYKPKQQFEQRFLASGGEGLEHDFVQMHINHIPIEPSLERTEQMLYSKLVAYYVQRGYTIKYDAASFYKMLRNTFVEDDGFWFNSNQIEAYREYKKKMRLEGIEDIKKGQMTLFVSDEKSALIWLHTFLNEPKDFQTIHPAFTKIANISGDQMPDLKELLETNFIREDDSYRRPRTQDEKLTITQKRERELLREFELLLLEAKGSSKKIKECRKQAVVYGFEYSYKRERFRDILTLAKRLDKKIIENDSEINEFIEVAHLKVEGF